MATRKERRSSVIVCGFVGIFLLFVPLAQAEQPFDITYCAAGALPFLYESRELAIGGFQGTGIIRSNHENKIFDKTTLQFMLVFKVIDVSSGKYIANGYVKLMDPDGDIIVVEDSGGPDETWKFLHGTGKWKGITGEGKAINITHGSKPIAPGTLQGCRRVTGTFELTK